MCMYIYSSLSIPLLMGTEVASMSCPFPLFLQPLLSSLPPLIAEILERIVDTCFLQSFLSYSSIHSTLGFCLGRSVETGFAKGTGDLLVTETLV